MQAEIPGLIAAHEAGDVLAGADQECPLRGDQPDPAAQDNRMHDRVPRQQQRRHARHVEQHHRGARIVVHQTRQEGEREKRHERHVPDIEHAPQVRPEREVMAKLVLAAKKARQHEQAGCRRADAEKAPEAAELAVHHDVIERAHQDRDEDDRGRVGEYAQHAHRVTGKRHPAARRMRSREQRMRHERHDAPVPQRHSLW